MVSLPANSIPSQPAYFRGDLLFLTNHPEPVRVGDVVVFRIRGRNIPIVHRVLKVHEKDDGLVSPLFLYIPS